MRQAALLSRPGTSPDVLYAPHQAVPLRTVSPDPPRRPVTISPDRHVPPSSPGPPPLNSEASHEEMLAHDEMVRQTWEEAHSLFNLSAGQLSPGSCGSNMELLNTAACEILLNDIRYPDGTLPDLNGGMDTPPPVLEGPPTFDRGTQVPHIRSCDSGDSGEEGHHQ